jgi:hypothetical protein
VPMSQPRGLWFRNRGPVAVFQHPCLRKCNEIVMLLLRMGLPADWLGYRGTGTSIQKLTRPVGVPI